MSSRVLELRDELRKLDAARRAIDSELAVLEVQLQPVGMKGPLVDGSCFARLRKGARSGLRRRASFWACSLRR